MFEFVRADIRRLTHQEKDVIGKVGVLLFNLGLHAVLLYRLSRWLHLHHMQPLAVLISYFNAVVTGAQISARAKIGKGLTLYHPQGTVVGATAVIGNYCTLMHGNVIGQLYGDDDRPTIGNDFYAGAGAKILGKIEIGNNVHVGANTVVMKSLPDGVTALGVPAKIVFRAGSAARSSGQETTSPEAVLQRLLPLFTSAVDVVTPTDSIRETTQLLGDGIGLDSIETLRLVSAIEEEFDLTIDEGELKVSHFQTVGSLLAFIQEKLSR